MSLERIMAPYTRVARDERLDVLVDALRERFADNLLGVLLYGSCRRSGDYADGLVDLYAVIESRAGAEPPFMRLTGSLLPPNVYYLERPGASGTVRCKCGVFTRAELWRGASADFHSYVWARLAQPTAIVWARDALAEAELRTTLAAAVRSFARRCRGLAESDDPAGMWAAGLARCYRAELRVERTERAAEILAAEPAYFRAVGAAALAEERPPELLPEHLEWGLRIAVGKLLSLARLIKGLASFDGAIDYVVFKLERHSGQRIEVPERVRRWPWAFVWGFAWRLYRRGVFR